MHFLHSAEKVTLCSVKVEKEPCVQHMYMHKFLQAFVENVAYCDYTQHDDSLTNVIVKFFPKNSESHISVNIHRNRWFVVLQESK